MLAIETEIVNLFSVYDNARNSVRTWIVEREGTERTDLRTAVVYLEPRGREVLTGGRPTPREATSQRRRSAAKSRGGAGAARTRAIP